MSAGYFINNIYQKFKVEAGAEFGVDVRVRSPSQNQTT